MIGSPALWGTEARLAELFPDEQAKASRQVFNFRHQLAEHWLDIFKNYYGPMNRAYAALDAAKQAGAASRGHRAASPDESRGNKP